MGGLSSDLWALGCIIYEISAGHHLFPLSIKVTPLDAISEIVHVLGNLPKCLSHSKFDDYGFPDPGGERILPDPPVGGPLSRLVAEIEAECGVDSEGAVAETQGLEEAQKNLATFRTYIKLDPKLFWRPLSTREITFVETLILSHEKTDYEIKLEKVEKALSKISSTEAEQLLNAVLRYSPWERKSAVDLAKHPWFAQRVRSEVSSSGKSRTGKMFQYLSVFKGKGKA